VSAANVHDSMMFEPMLDAITPLKTGWRGRPRHRPDKAHADKGYDDRKCRAARRRRKITHRIARKAMESTEKLGRHRWVIERTLAWLARYRRLARRGKAKAQVAVARSIMVIIWHLLADPAARFTDLGPGYYQAHTDTDRKLRNHLRQIQALGFDVTLTKAG